MNKPSRLKGVHLTPMMMGLAVMLTAAGLHALPAGSKPLKNDVIDVIQGLNVPFGVVVSKNSKSVYVADFGKSIDAVTGQIINDSIVVSGGGEVVAVTPNGKRLHVTHFDGALGFATKNLSQTQTLTNSDSANVGLAISPNGKTLYVVGDASPRTVSVFDTVGKGKLATSIGVGNDPIDVAFTPNGKTAYVTNSGDGTVCVIDVKTESVTATIPGFDRPYGINVTRDGKTAYVLNTDSVSVIDTKTNAVIGAAIDLSPYGTGTGYFMALTPDSKYLYVPVNNFPNSPGALVVINTGTNLVTLPAPAAQLGDEPTAVAISPDGKRAYVTDKADGTVTVIAISGD